MVVLITPGGLVGVSLYLGTLFKIESSTFESPSRLVPLSRWGLRAKLLVNFVQRHSSRVIPRAFPSTVPSPTPLGSASSSRLRLLRGDARREKPHQPEVWQHDVMQPVAGKGKSLTVIEKPGREKDIVRLRRSKIKLGYLVP